MGKKTGGGGASPRGSHHLADNGGCEERWHNAHWRKLYPKKGSYYADFGTMLHTVLAYHYVEMSERKPQWYLDQPNAQEAIEADALGKPAWLRTALEFKEWYRNHTAGEGVVPLFIEENFEATVGEVDPNGEDEPPFEMEYESECRSCLEFDGPESHVPHKVKRILSLPSLNEEVVTCRPDLIHRKNGANGLRDHKSGGAAKDGSGRLPVLDESKPDLRYVWQAMYNLVVVRARMEIDYFEFNRVKRDRPFDQACDPFVPPMELYATVPATIREMVRHERRLAIKAARGEKMIKRPWECKIDFECGYTRLCFADTAEERMIIEKLEYQDPAR